MNGFYTFLIAVSLSTGLLSFDAGAYTSPPVVSERNLTPMHPIPSDEKPMSTGLKAEYYNGINFENKLLTRIEDQVNYQWTHQKWLPGLDELFFSARWTGILYAPADGTFTLVTRVDDGIRLWLGGKLLIDEWHGQSVTTYKRIVQMKAGKYYNLKIEYFNHYGPGAMQLFWETPPMGNEAETDMLSNRPRTLIPKDFFFTSLPAAAHKPMAEKPRQVAAKLIEKPAPVAVATARNTGKKPVQPVREADGIATKPTVETSPDSTGTKASPAPTILPKLEETFEQPEIGKAIVLNHALFEQSRYVLLSSSYAELDKLVRSLLKYPNLHIEISGHTDNMGDPRLNQALSENRAIVVANYLIRQGIDEKRITAKGYGSTQPIADNSSEMERAKNRRVEFTVR